MSFQEQDYLSRQAGNRQASPYPAFPPRRQPLSCIDDGVRPNTKQAGPSTKYAKITTLWENEENKENIPPPTLNKEDAYHVSKKDPESDRDKEAGHDGTRKHFSCPSGKCWGSYSNVGFSSARLVERHSPLPLRHSNRGIHNASQRPTPKLDTLHCWPKGDYYHPDRYK